MSTNGSNHAGSQRAESEQATATGASEAGEAAALIEVLLATCNGAAYLREQLDSVLAQSYPHLRILARDDGSTDGTPAILAEYAAQHPGRMRVLTTGAPSGNAKWNFMQLLAASVAPYVAFCDQDDVWLPGKLRAELDAMHQLERAHGADTPLLVFSDLRVVGRDLHELAASFWAQQNVRPQYIRQLPRLLTGNVVTGCTALINAPLRARALPMPATAYMHDWWLALVVSIFGHATYLDEPTVLYRQHGGNVLGASQAARPAGVPRWRYHDKRRERWERAERQAEGLLATLGAQMPTAARHIVEAYVRCEQSPHRVVRLATFLRHGFYLTDGVRSNLAMLWYLWDMRAAKAQRGAETIQ